jgi:uncharacterized protein (DUF1800 family)
MVGRREQLGAVAATRFGLGARPGEIARLSTDPVGALLAQTRPEAAPLWAGRSHSAELIAEFRRLEDVEPDSEVRRTWRWGAAFEELLIRAQHASTTPYDFRERWITFWANTFALQVGDLSALLAGSFVREALEPHAFGRFADMAAASTRHPAMMLALDQVNSVGPNSAFGRATGQGLNENLARELMELHTLGADAGYSQTDVTEMARVLTGWRIGDADAPYPLRHRFQADPARREPGERRVLGRSWPESGERAETVVRWLADHPATASHMARKLARHFEADDPSPSLVERLRAAWRDGGGDLRLVAEALVTAPEMWRASSASSRRPMTSSSPSTARREPSPTTASCSAPSWRAWACTRYGHAPRRVGATTPPSGPRLRAWGCARATRSPTASAPPRRTVATSRAAAWVRCCARRRRRRSP